MGRGRTVLCRSLNVDLAVQQRAALSTGPPNMGVLFYDFPFVCGSVCRDLQL